MSKKKIAVIGLKGLPGFGGAARAGESVIDILKTKYDYTVYAISSHTQHHGEYNGYRQHVFRSLKHQKLNVFFYYLKSAFHCLFIANYDLVQINHVESGFIAPLLRLKYKVVGTARGSSQKIDKWSSADKKFFLLFEWLFLRFSTRIVAVSKPHISRYERATQKPVVYIPNGINIEESYDEPTHEEDYLFFAAGRIISIKGCHTLLSALNLMNYRGKVLIAGDLDQVPAYRKEVLTLSKNLDIQFLGLIKEKKVLMSYLKKARVFIFPSFVEAMSNMLLEAASMQTPIICSDIVENRAIFDEKEITFFRTGDAADLAEKIADSLEQPVLMHNKATMAFKKLESQYQWKQIALAYDQLYKSLV